MVSIIIEYRNGTTKEIMMRGYNKARDFMIKLLRDDATVYSCDFAA